MTEPQHPFLTEDDAELIENFIIQVGILPEFEIEFETSPWPIPEVWRSLAAMGVGATMATLHMIDQGSAFALEALMLEAAQTQQAHDRGEHHGEPCTEPEEWPDGEPSDLG